MVLPTRAPRNVFLWRVGRPAQTTTTGFIWLLGWGKNLAPSSPAEIVFLSRSELQSRPDYHDCICFAFLGAAAASPAEPRPYLFFSPGRPAAPPILHKKYGCISWTGLQLHPDTIDRIFAFVSGDITPPRRPRQHGLPGWGCSPTQPPRIVVFEFLGGGSAPPRRPRQYFSFFGRGYRPAKTPMVVFFVPGWGWSPV